VSLTESVGVFDTALFDIFKLLFRDQKTHTQPMPIVFSYYYKNGYPHLSANAVIFYTNTIWLWK